MNKQREKRAMLKRQNKRSSSTKNKRKKRIMKNRDYKKFIDVVFGESDVEKE